ncbi:TIR domain-containing protein [Burkholderia stagnalis]
MEKKKLRKAFYSWQSDLPNKTNRSFILDTLRRAVKDINSSDDPPSQVLTEAQRPQAESTKPVQVDQATSGVAGAVHIAHTILDKIREADVFIADISTINKGTKKFRKGPNPNVLFELGYAWAELGYKRVVLVFNEATTSEMDIPFDIRGHKFVVYRLDECTISKEKSEVRQHLQSCLKREIAAILEEQPPRPSQLRGLSEDQVRIAHDRETLVQVFSHINLSILDDHLANAPAYYSLAIAYLWDEFDAFYMRSAFHVHDARLKGLLAQFVRAWRSSMPGDGTDFYRDMPDPCRQRYMNDFEASQIHARDEWKAGYTRLRRGNRDLRRSLNSLLSYVRLHFPNIDIERLGSECGVTIARQLKVIRKGIADVPE